MIEYIDPSTATQPTLFKEPPTETTAGTKAYTKLAIKIPTKIEPIERYSGYDIDHNNPHYLLNKIIDKLNEIIEYI